MESDAEHCPAKLPVALQVNLNGPSSKVTVFVGEMTTPLMSIHSKLGSGKPLASQVNTSPGENGPVDGVMVTAVGQPTDVVVFIL